MLQHLIVMVIVGAAALYSAWALMPAAARRNAAARLAGRATQWGLAEARARELERSLASSGGCSDCSSCKGCSTPQAGGESAAPAGPTVVAMPVSRRGMPH